jgi:hypothetical protein
MFSVRSKMWPKFRLRGDRAFLGMPDGVTMHSQLLAAFKAAAPRLGLSPRLVHAIDRLFRFTMAQDWGRGGGLSCAKVPNATRAVLTAKTQGIAPLASKRVP